MGDVYVGSPQENEYLSRHPDRVSDFTGSNQVVEDAETKAFKDWYKHLDSSLSAETKDYLVQNYFNKQSEERAFKREMEASSTQYQRMVKDLQAAGLNPFLAINGLSSGSIPSSSAQGVSGGLFSATKKQKMSSAGSAVGALIAALALIAVKLLA